MNLEIENYEWEEIHKILGKINNRILEYILRNQMELMCQNEMIILNDEALKLNRIFGFSCFSSPSLSNLEFEIR